MKQAVIRARIETDPVPDSEAPSGPSEAEESAYIAGQAKGPYLSSSRPVAQAIDENLPAMEELNKRIPPEVLTKIDELFRAKFARVLRVSEKNLKQTK